MRVYVCMYICANIMGMYDTKDGLYSFYLYISFFYLVYIIQTFYGK